ncbi:TPA: hypothetical protein ACGB80_002058 [Listeria monocytogenes]
MCRFKRSKFKLCKFKQCTFKLDNLARHRRVNGNLRTSRYN